MSLNAFVVTMTTDTVSVLVFADDRTEAVGIAHKTEWFEDVEWIDLRCKRCPSVDNRASEFGKGAVAGESANEQRLLRGLGWWQIDWSTESCRECYLHEWPDVPESKLIQDEKGCICMGCLERLGEE